jgi:hypothetical protein
LLGTKVELLKEFFTKQFIVEFCAWKLSMLGVVVKIYKYSMKHKRNGGPKHTT